MQRADIKMRLFYTFATIFGLVLFTSGFALASESVSGWRSTYDLVMRWINFGIIVFLLVKFGKKPLMNFLHTRKESLARDIETLEEKKEKASLSIREARLRLEDSRAHLDEIKDKIVRRGVRQRQNILDEARAQSVTMMESARRRVESAMRDAKNSFRSELVDAAFNLAMEKIPDKITKEDNHKLILQYLDATSASNLKKK